MLARVCKFESCSGHKPDCNLQSGFFMIQRRNVISFEKSSAHKGLDLKTIFGIEQPTKDFYGNPVPPGAVTEPGIYEMK